MEIGEKYFGGVTMEDETDYYKFEMPYDGYAFLQFYTPHLKHFTLFDSDKNEVGSISIEIDEEDLVYELRSGLKKGTYYVSVRPDEDYTKPIYSIEVETKPDTFFEKEYNNEKEFATVLSYGKEYQGNLFGTEDIDVYSFTLPIDCKITLDFTDTHVAKGGHYKIKLENDTSVLYTSDNAGRKTISLDLAAGTYYFTVESLGLDNYTSMAYKIKVTTNKDFPKDVEEDKNSKANDEAEYTPEETVQFADVSMNDWFYGEVLEAKKLGLVDGIGDNKFNPKGNVTLAEVITMAVRIKNEKDGKNTEITVSPVGKWYNSYITFAVNSGIIKIGDFDDFERNATREEVAYIFANVLGEIEIDENLIIPDVDRNSVSVYKLFSAGILKGDTDGKFRPGDNITRAEATAILLRVYKTN